MKNFSFEEHTWSDASTKVKNADNIKQCSKRITQKAKTKVIKLGQKQKQMQITNARQTENGGVFQKTNQSRCNKPEDEQFFKYLKNQNFWPMFTFL